MGIALAAGKLQSCKLPGCVLGDVLGQTHFATRDRDDIVWHRTQWESGTAGELPDTTVAWDQGTFSLSAKL